MGGQRRHGTLSLQRSARQRPVLFFQLTTTFSLLPLDAFAFLQREHLLVLNPQFPTLQLKVVEHLNHGSRFLCGGEIGKRQTAEDAVVKVVVESVGQGKVQLGHQLHQLFFLDGERDILDDDGGRDQLIVDIRSRGGIRTHCAALERTGANVGEGAGDARLLIQPGLVAQRKLVLPLHYGWCVFG